MLNSQRLIDRSRDHTDRHDRSQLVSEHCMYRQAVDCETLGRIHWRRQKFTFGEL